MFENILKKLRDKAFEGNNGQPSMLGKMLGAQPVQAAKPTPVKQIQPPKIGAPLPVNNAIKIIQGKQPGVSAPQVYGKAKPTPKIATRITPTKMPTATPTPAMPTVTPPPDKSAVPYYQMINEAAMKHKVPQKILYNLLRTESMGFNPSVIDGKLNSPVGAQGIAQFMPATAKGIGVNPLDPPAAIDASAKYLFRKYLEHGKDWRLALAAYNAGSGNVRKYGGVPPFKETQDYIKRIMEEGD